MADAGALGASTLSMGQTVVAYQFFLPRLNEVREADADDPTMRGNVILGQVAAGALSVTVGIMLAWLTGSAIPIYTALFIALVIAAIYHYAMNV